MRHAMHNTGTLSVSTRSAFHLIAIWSFLLFTISAAQADQCSQPVYKSDGGFYQLTRMENISIPPDKTFNLSHTLPTYAALENMNLIPSNPDGHLNQMFNQAPPREVAPLMMIATNSDSHVLAGVEIAAISETDCLPGFIQSTGEYVVCTQNPTGYSPFEGEYLFTYYQSVNGVITAQVRKKFTIGELAFLPVLAESYEADGTVEENEKLIARGIVVNVSSLGIIPDTEQPSYYSVQYIPKKHWDSSKDEADKFVYQVFSELSAPQPTACTDYLRMGVGDGGEDGSTGVGLCSGYNDSFALNSLPSIAHAAGAYTLVPTNSTDGAAGIQSCLELQEISDYVDTLSEPTVINIFLDSPTNVIDCTGLAFKPIDLELAVRDRNNKAMYAAVNLIGNGHTIRGLNITNWESSQQGLFELLPNGSSVHDLIIDNATVHAAALAGAVAGVAGLNVTFHNVEVKNSTVIAFSMAGGIAGTIARSSAPSNDLSVTNSYIIGYGLVGSIAGRIGEHTVNNVVRSGAVSGNYHHSTTFGYGSAVITGIDEDSVVIRNMGAPPVNPGDYNHDRIVDVTDHRMFRYQFNITVPNGFAADGNSDGRVDMADYTIWRNNLGAQY